MRLAKIRVKRYYMAWLKAAEQLKIKPANASKGIDRLGQVNKFSVSQLRLSNASRLEC